MMRAVRLWLPAAICVAGVVVIVATGGSTEGWEGGFLLISAGLSVLMLNVFYRLSVRGDQERDTEDAARAYFDEHGRWPGEPGPAGPGTPPDPHERGDATVPPHGGRRRR